MIGSKLSHSALLSRVWLITTGATVGMVIGVVLVGLLLIALGDPLEAVNTSFSMSSLVLGLATLGWSGSVLAGRGIETIQNFVLRDSNWSERDSRRAMARLIGLGAGGMLGAMLSTPFVL
jgi:hypothetical protein